MKVTEKAADLLKRVVGGSDSSEDAGVRVQPGQDDQSPIGIALRDQPEQGDEVIEENGMRVFVAAEVLEIVADMTLDAVDTPQGEALTLR